MCLMIWLMVGWKSSLMASEDIRSIPWDDHFTKLTLGRERRSGVASRQRFPRPRSRPPHLPLFPPQI